MWAPTFLLFWNRRTKRLQHKWGLEGFREVQYVNPAYRSDLVIKSLFFRCRGCARILQSQEFREQKDGEVGSEKPMPVMCRICRKRDQYRRKEARAFPNKNFEAAAAEHRLLS